MDKDNEEDKNVLPEDEEESDAFDFEDALAEEWTDEEDEMDVW